MTFTRLRAVGAGYCLVATAMMLPAGLARAKPIPSQLSIAPDVATARMALSDALARERLSRLGFSCSDANRLMEATREARVEALLNRACQVTDGEGKPRLLLNADVLQIATQRIRDSLSNHGLDDSAILASLERGLRTAGENTPHAWLETLGLESREAALLTEELTGAELAWLGEHTTVATTYVGKVVGVNWTGLLLLVLPLVGVAWVAAAGTGEAAGVAVAGLLVGLIFVLFAEPEFLFGSHDDVIL